MNTQYFLAFLFLITGLLFLIQRAEPSSRRIVILVMIVPATLIRNFATYRYIETNSFSAIRDFTVYQSVETEALTALWVAILLNLAYWVLIGRTLSRRPKEEIKVLKLDD